MTKLLLVYTLLSYAVVTSIAAAHAFPSIGTSHHPQTSSALALSDTDHDSTHQFSLQADSAKASMADCHTMAASDGSDNSMSSACKIFCAANVLTTFATTVQLGDACPSAKPRYFANRYLFSFNKRDPHPPKN